MAKPKLEELTKEVEGLSDRYFELDRMGIRMGLINRELFGNGSENAKRYKWQISDLQRAVEGKIKDKLFKIWLNSDMKEAP